MAAAYRTAPDSVDAVRADLDALVADRPDPFRSADQVGSSDVVASYLGNSEVADADHGRMLHLRRQLEAAAEHGAALMAALGLPRLVTDCSIQVDPAAAADALDSAIAALDALDGDPEAEPSLGAAENHPARWHVDMDGRYHTGRGRRQLGDQTHWSAGHDREGNGDEGESEAGYDLPEGDTELDDDGLWKGEGDDAEHEQNLGAPAGDGDQRHWAQGDGRDYEDMAEGDGELTADWYKRPIGPSRPSARGYEHDGDMRALSRQAQAVKRRVSGPPPRRDPDLLSFASMPPGTALWRPSFTRDGVEVVGVVSR